MIPLPCRTKGGAPQLGAKGPGQTGPFGRWPDLDKDDDQADGEQQADS
ncbi:hypothetical protein PV383_04475 [Streptomyces caniscabiei]|uniref:Uncharacterized protein n=1 Tax=Streptomyces caniscabiei TaxID=2746961 RepID=A0ABU4MGZ7_9ACTN|nr:hypothetical protein [Streptomyces caniscabiei]MDX2943305.1 hypothetical protein [Streptomyces caniscabiei]MDX3036426.1 hypothetical protein [Streptomyces caniscabiei]